jgi:hypothetical protein
MVSCPSKFRLSQKSAVLAVLIALLSQGGRVLADVVSSGASAQEAHAKLCKCERCHRDTCCCGRSPGSPSKSGEGAPAPANRDQPSGVRSWCLVEAPCGDPSVPGATTRAPGLRVATLAVRIHFRPQIMSDLLATPASSRASWLQVSRIDRPPRLPRSA